MTRKNRKTKKKYDEAILEFLGEEKDCSDESLQSYVPTVADLNEYDEWIDWLRTEIKDARYKNDTTELQTLNRQLQAAKENKRKIVKLLSSNGLMDGANKTMEVCYS